MEDCVTAGRELRVGIGVVATVAVFTATYLAEYVFAPVAFALFIIAIVWPVQSRLQSYLPKLLALAIVVAITVVVVLAFASLAAWAFGRVARWLISEGARFQLIYEQTTIWLEEHGIAVARLWADHFNVGWLLRAMQGITGRVNTTMVFWLIVLVYVILGLLEVEQVAAKLRTMPNQEAARVLIEGSAATAAKFRRYMVVRTLMSLITGVLVWAFVWFSGLPLAAEWGAIAFALNYVPFVGPFIATLFPTLLASAQFTSWAGVLAVFVGLNVIQFVVGSYVEPRVTGTVLAISPFVVLFAVFFWTFLWGLCGAFIGVPIAIAMLTFCAQHRSSRWISDLLGASVPPPQAGRPH
jgi:predicted PurR-regulated permease PerM